ncbi:VOC family protein [Peribacillus tepidiphilus]|uniref:VOC family protein n=1 Tax=Peribacillus tepidiphilus TaxID=2652445 RepID=UPI0012922490|nr:VOC family protein [Peribacillus tepidiphilus]
MLKFDHIVHFVEGESRKAAEMFQALGKNAVRGGKHVNWGTENSLYYAGLSYIEFLAIENEQKTKESDNPLIQLFIKDLEKEEGFGQICIRTDDIEKEKQRLEADGFITSQVFKGERIREDGKLLSWKMLFIESDPSLSLPDPFFIQWNESDEDRMNDLTVSGLIKGNQQDEYIRSVYFVVKDLPKMRKRWEKILNQHAISTFDDWLKENCEVFQVNNTQLVFLPKVPDRFQVSGNRGDRPFLVVLNNGTEMHHVSRGYYFI